MTTLDECAKAIGDLQARLESSEHLADLLDRVLAEIWWKSSDDAKRDIREFHKAYLEHKTLVARLSKR